LSVSGDTEPDILDLSHYEVYTGNMTKKLVKHGNSAALVLDKPILDLLNVKMDTPLEITTDGKNIIISPAASDNDEKDLLAELAKVNKNHHKTLAKLAK
jgi:antitoxin component of MazEF toxin-antitoxin module